MSQSPIVLPIEGLSLQRCDDEVVRVRDVDLGEKLGMKEPRAIRKLIARLIESQEIEGVLSRDAVSRGKFRGKVQEEIVVMEYWLDREQCWLVCMHSDAPHAKNVRKLIARVFDRFLTESAAQTRSANSIVNRVLAALLAPKPTEWELCFHDTLVRELATLDGYDWNGGSHPRYLRSTNWKIYNMIFSSEVGRALKAKCPNPRHGDNLSQHLTPEARDYFRAQLRVVEAIARQSASKDDFWTRMAREYAGGFLQLSLSASRA